MQAAIEAGVQKSLLLIKAPESCSSGSLLMCLTGEGLVGAQKSAKMH